MKKLTMIIASAATILVLNGCSSEEDVKDTVTGFMKATNEGSYKGALNYASQEMVDNMVNVGMMAALFDRKSYRDCKKISFEKPIAEQADKAQKCFSSMYKNTIKDFEILSAEEKSENQYVVHYIANGKEDSYKVLNIKDKWTVTGGKK